MFGITTLIGSQLACNGRRQTLQSWQCGIGELRQLVAVGRFESTLTECLWITTEKRRSVPNPLARRVSLSADGSETLPTRVGLRSI